MKIIKKMMQGLLLCLAASPVFACSSSLTDASACYDITCVRTQIDAIDADIVKLIGKRLTYVARAGELKAGKKAVHDAAREKQILTTVAQEASALGYPEAIIVAVYKTLLQQTNLYEQQAQRSTNKS